MFVMPEQLNAEVAEHQRRLSYWVEVRRESLGLNKTVFLRYTGLSKTGLSYALSGEREPGLRTLLAIARALDCEVADLFLPIPEDAPGEA